MGPYQLLVTPYHIATPGVLLRFLLLLELELELWENSTVDHEVFGALAHSATHQLGQPLQSDKKMGLFNRKGSKVSTDGDSTASITSRHSQALKSPPLKTPNGAHFASSSMPDVTLPKAPDPKVDPAAYLRSIHAVRERSKYVYEKAKRNKLTHFDVDMSHFGATARYTVSIIKVGHLCRRQMI